MRPLVCTMLRPAKDNEVPMNFIGNNGGKSDFDMWSGLQRERRLRSLVSSNNFIHIMHGTDNPWVWGSKTLKIQFEGPPELVFIKWYQSKKIFICMWVGRCRSLEEHMSAQKVPRERTRNTKRPSSWGILVRYWVASAEACYRGLLAAHCWAWGEAQRYGVMQYEVKGRPEWRWKKQWKHLIKRSWRFSTLGVWCRSRDPRNQIQNLELSRRQTWPRGHDSS
jgi:hypothetical protein